MTMKRVLAELAGYLLISGGFLYYAFQACYP
jgi:hypothetical protein